MKIGVWLFFSLKDGYESNFSKSRVKFQFCSNGKIKELQIVDRTLTYQHLLGNRHIQVLQILHFITEVYEVLCYSFIDVEVKALF